MDDPLTFAILSHLAGRATGCTLADLCSHFPNAARRTLQRRLVSLAAEGNIQAHGTQACWVSPFLPGRLPAERHDVAPSAPAGAPSHRRRLDTQNLIAFGGDAETVGFNRYTLPYLQPIDDVHKRMSRLAANIPFIRENHAPLSFGDHRRTASRRAAPGALACRAVRRRGRGCARRGAHRGGPRAGCCSARGRRARPAGRPRHRAHRTARRARRQHRPSPHPTFGIPRVDWRGDRRPEDAGG